MNNSSQYNKTYLIQKLYQQLNDNADDAQLYETAHLLIAVLQRPVAEIRRGVTVVTPSLSHHPSPEIKRAGFIQENEHLPVEVQKIERKKSKHSRLIEKELSFFNIFEEERPATLQQSLFDGTQAQAIEINEKLKNIRKEISESQPINDLKSGIGINDKYLFINHLFRGDATAYERSILTINNFRSLQESMDWIERELRITYAWAEKDKTVQNFYNIIKRRFKD